MVYLRVIIFEMGGVGVLGIDTVYHVSLLMFI